MKMASFTVGDPKDKPWSSCVPKTASRSKLNISKCGFNIFQDTSCPFLCFQAVCYRRVPQMETHGLWQQMFCKAPESWVSPCWGERIDRKHSTWTPVCLTLCFLLTPPSTSSCLALDELFQHVKSSLPSGTIGSACPMLLSWDKAHSAPPLLLRPPKLPLNGCHNATGTHTLVRVPQCHKHLAWPGASQAPKPMYHTNSASNPVRSKDMCGVPQLLNEHCCDEGKYACQERWVSSSTMHCDPQRSAPGISLNPSPNTCTYPQAKEQLLRPWISRITVLQTYSKHNISNRVTRMFFSFFSCIKQIYK